MITPLAADVLSSRLLPLIDHPDPAVVRRAAELGAAAGLPCLEVGLRHPRSVEALAAAVDAVDIPVGAGTVTDRDSALRAAEAGAAFLVSPGCTPRLAEAVAETRLAWLPGVATASEVLAARELGATTMKVFPARALGGAAYVSSLAAAFPNVRFVPTGGIGAADVADYLALGSVVAVGGTWMFPLGTGGSGEIDDAAISAAVTVAIEAARPR